MIDWTDIQIGIAPACGWSFQANGGESLKLVVLSLILVLLLQIVYMLILPDHL